MVPVNVNVLSDYEQPSINRHSIIRRIVHYLYLRSDILLFDHESMLALACRLMLATAVTQLIFCDHAMVVLAVAVPEAFQVRTHRHLDSRVAITALRGTWLIDMKPVVECSP